MRPIRFTFGGLAAASVNNIAQSQTLGSATTVTLNGSAVSGGVATLDQARRVIITSAGNDSAVTFTITGTSRSGVPISESLAGANIGAAQSTNDFATVTKVASSAATSSIQVGTNGLASIYVPLDVYANPTNVSVNCVVTGTINYTVSATTDDIYASSGLAPTNFFSTAVIAAGAVTAQGNLTKTATALQFLINSGTGSIAIQVVQAGGTSAA